MVAAGTSMEWWYPAEIVLLSTAEKVLPLSEPLLNDVVFSVCALTTVKQYGYRCSGALHMCRCLLCLLLCSV